jgi:arylsulfatase A-like enzyme
MQIPLILHHPGKISEGVQVDKIINQYDIFPTLLEYAGMGDKAIANSPGKSFMPMLQGNDIESWDDAAFFEFVTVRVIRTSRWKYMKRLDEDEPDTLYDLKNDPGEKINLVENPDFAEIRRSLETRLVAFFGQYSDQKYDVWNGGTAKGILLEKYYGRDDIFKSRFPGWQEPSLEKAKHVFSDVK